MGKVELSDPHDKARTFHVRLQERTRSGRQAVSELNRVARLKSPQLKPQEYVITLKRLFGFHAAMEWRIERSHLWDALDVDIRARRKAALILDDLTYIGIGEKELAAICHNPNLPPLRAFSHVVGAMYVLESMTLDGLAIAENVTRCLGYTRDAGCTYFTGYGPDFARMWREWQRVMEQLLHDGVITGAGVTHAACETFEALRITLAD